MVGSTKRIKYVAHKKKNCELTSSTLLKKVCE